MIGKTLGPYEIVSPLGAGGMGEVYRARDTQLGRDVAIKILPEAFATDPDRLARFEREAKTLAALNDPHIAQIYGLEKSGDVRALVLELVDGPTLADRIAQGPIPIDEALPIARQIADALEAAHEQGIIHRDLKPANIKVRDDGTVKVLDFGLAKALTGSAASAGSAGSIANSPTITSPALMTNVGVILGTAAYMSPEQAKGREADKRSDIWAFGCVLYEMLTGQRPFDGEDMTDVLGAVVRLEPKWEALPSEVPHALHTLIQRCLMKDRKHRVADIAAVKFVLSELASLAGRSDGTTSATQPLWRRALRVTAVATVAAVAGGAAIWTLRPSPPAPRVVQFSMSLPPGQLFSGTSRQVVAISPNGDRIAYVANAHIYLRSVGELEPREIRGAESRSQTIVSPMFAPDGESIAFLDQSSPVTIKRVPINGGTASTVAVLSGPDVTGASWGPGGILVSRRRERGVFRVSPGGGALERLATVGEDEAVQAAQLLPDGRTLLFTLVKLGNDGTVEKTQVVSQSVPDGARRILIDGGSDGRYVLTGHLLYAIEGTIFAVPFNLQSHTVTGAAVPVIAGVSRSFGFQSTPGAPTPRFVQGAAQLAFSDTGTLVYVPGVASARAPMFRLLLGDNRSDGVPLEIPPGGFVYPRVSPDGRTLAIGIDDGQGSDVWVYELSGKSAMRKLTFGGDNRFPVWSADSRRVAFQSRRDGDRAIFWQVADGSRPAERLTKPEEGEEQVPESWSPDGRHLLFAAGKGTSFFLRILTLDDRKTEAFGKIQSAELTSATFSPDGRWVAYAYTDGSGPATSNRGVFVEPFPPTGEKHQTPKTGNDYHPLWSRDGKNIFYVPTSGRPILAVPITMSPSIAFGTPMELPHAPRPNLRSSQQRGYDQLPDGRFISVSEAYGDGSTVGEIRVVLNWFEELKRLVPTK